MTSPRVFLHVRHVANQTCNFGVEHIKSAWRARDLGHQSPLCILDAQDAGIDEDLEPNFIELTNTEDVSLELGNEIDFGEDSVLPASAAEDDSVTSFDAHHRPVIESDCSTDVGVELRKGTTGTSHVVGGPGVDHPSRGVGCSSLFTNLSEHLLLHRVDCGSSHTRRQEHRHRHRHRWA
jgi:hypothetical protein